MHAVPRRELYAKMDAANVDLKAFTDEFYFRICGGKLQPVLDTLEYLVKETSVWTEITTLLIPGKNDSDEELRAECKWIREHLGQDVPLHFTAFHPDWKMTDIAATPPSTLTRAREIGQLAGLNYVYTGNVHDEAGGSTYCPSCEKAVIRRLRRLRHAHRRPLREVRQALRPAPHSSQARAAGLKPGPGTWLAAPDASAL
jgi:pyruvate formate lyase activating enzyme